MSKVESRTFSGEFRAESDFVITGYAALFNSPSKDLGGFVETIDPTAFARSLAENAPVQFTFNHSQDFILARNSNATLTLSTDSRGLKFRAQLNSKIQSHCDIWEACRSGLYTECSFAFIVAENGQSWSPDGRQRTLLDVDLMDCAIVGTPAYNGTSATARNNNSDAAFVEATRARLATMQADWKRSDRAHDIRMGLIAEGRRADNADDDDPDDPDIPFEKACREHNPPLDFCDADEHFIYGSDPDDISDEQNCLRFEYQIDDEGNVVLDESTRTKTKHELSHSERGRRIMWLKSIARRARGSR
jgi:hypothetical protein